VLIAQISDTHILAPGQLAYRRVDTAACLARAVQHLLRLVPPPDAVLATGDLVDGGQPDEYRHLRELLEPLAMPVYLIPGNHDDRDALARAFPDHGYLPRDGFMQYVLDQYPVRLIGLDTLVPGTTGGAMCEARCAWLAEALARSPGRPTMLFMHHAPFRTGIERMDLHGLDGIDRMAAVVERHPQIERIVCGHLHRPIQVRWSGTVVMTAPSTAHQVALDLRPEAPLAFAMEPPAVLLHTWLDGAGLVTHTSFVGDYAGPYPFREPAPPAA
jgi:3',5'-cyclic AMP phosphodiesterase CpdA